MADDRRPPRSFRRDVDEDIRQAERSLQERQAELRAAERARLLFGGSEESSGFLGRGRTNRGMDRAREDVKGASGALNDAREYRREYPDERPVGSAGRPNLVYKKGGPVKKMASGGAVKSSASSRADGCAARGKTKGRMV
jgi:hypothetical protein